MADIGSYIGFAVRSGKIIYGIDNIEASRKRKYALVLCITASGNLVKNAVRYAEINDIPLVTTMHPLEDIVYKHNCKIIALLDRNLAKAVIETAGR